MKRKLISVAAAALVSCGIATTVAATPASADPLSDLIATLLAGSSDGGHGGGPANPGPASNGVTAVQVTTGVYRGPGNQYGRKLGPDLYAMTKGKFRVSVKYNAVTSAGGENRADNCRIELRVSGPQNTDVYKTAKCSGYGDGPVVTQTGRYTATVTDRVSGRTGQSTFTIE